MSTVDVVVPCYNYGRYLEYCVGTVLSQRDVDVRVLIIDDKSPDDTPEVGARLAARDPRVTYRRHENNRGLIGTANEGIMDWATAPYTLLLSADDALTPGALARATALMDEHETVGMAYGRAILLYDDDEQHSSDDPRAFDYKVVAGSRFLEHSCEHGNGVPSPTAVVRTALLHRLGGYHPKFPHTSDMEMWMRLATCSSIGAIKEMQGYYRCHSSNMTLQHIATSLGDRRKRLDTCIHVYNEWNGDKIPGFADWIFNMKRKLSREALWLATLAVEMGRPDDARECTEFADEFCPELRYSMAGVRLRLKTLLGPAIIRQLRRTLKKELPGTQTGTETASSWLRSETAFGWWPEHIDARA